MNYTYAEKERARRVMVEAIRTGALVRPYFCDKCGERPSKHKIEGHHKDYSRPLEVIWLCKPCHAKCHARVRDGKWHTVAVKVPERVWINLKLHRAYHDRPVCDLLLEVISERFNSNPFEECESHG